MLDKILSHVNIEEIAQIDILELTYLGQRQSD